MMAPYVPGDIVKLLPSISTAMWSPTPFAALISKLSMYRRLEAARLNRMNQNMRQVVRQASLDPGEGIEL